MEHLESWRYSSKRMSILALLFKDGGKFGVTKPRGRRFQRYSHKNAASRATHPRGGRVWLYSPMKRGSGLTHILMRRHVTHPMGLWVVILTREGGEVIPQEGSEYGGTHPIGHRPETHPHRRSARRPAQPPRCGSGPWLHRMVVHQSGCVWYCCCCSSTNHHALASRARSSNRELNRNISECALVPKFSTAPVQYY